MMKTNRNRRSLVFSALMLVALLSFSVVAQDRASAEESFRELPGSNPHAFIGTWVVQTTITNCSGTTLESFSKLVSINEGGTLSETSSSTLYRSVALGVWGHIWQNDFVYAQRFFRFNPDGTSSGSVRAKWTVLLGADGDTYTATGAVQILLPNGTVVANPCGTETASRMVIPN
jgi:hypothetical protein